LRLHARGQHGNAIFEPFVSSKSRSFTRSRTHSIKRIPVPYKSLAIRPIVLRRELGREIFEWMKLGLPNHTLERTGLSLSVGPWSFWFARVSSPVAQLGRSAASGRLGWP